MRPARTRSTTATPQSASCARSSREADAVQLALVRGAQLPDPDGLLTGSGKQLRVLVFASVDDVDEGIVTRYLDLTVELGTALRVR